MFDGPWESCVLVRGLNPSECASWVQAWGSIGAICGAAVAVWLAHRFEVKRAEAADRIDRHRATATLLLSLQTLAAELNRMNVLVGFQIDAKGNPILYPDIPAEFNALAEMLNRLPIEQIATMGKMPVFLTLRRAAAELALVYQPTPVQGDGFYRRNRVRLHELEGRCSKASMSLAADIEALDPALYEANKSEILRM